MGVGEAGGTGGTEGEADAFGGREGSVHRFAAAWVRVRAAFGEGSCVLRETIRKGRPRFCDCVSAAEPPPALAGPSADAHCAVCQTMAAEITPDEARKRLTGAQPPPPPQQPPRPAALRHSLPAPRDP